MAEAAGPATANHSVVAPSRPTIEDSFSNRRNSLNFLRLVLAVAVIFSHSIVLGSFGSESILGKTTLGSIAVYGFFGISGYLIAGSAARNNVGRYLWQRFLRIFPAFWVCLVVTAFVFGTVAWFHSNPQLSSACGLHCYLNEPYGPVGYVVHNFWLQINQGIILKTLPGSFINQSWDGSLWTLQLEFLCYLLLAGLSVLGLLKRRALVAVLAAAAWIAEIVLVSVPTLARDLSAGHSLGVQGIGVIGFRVPGIALLGLASIFLAGSLLYLYRDKIPDSGFIALGATALVVAGLFIPIGQPSYLYDTTSFFVTAIFLPYPLIWLGIHLPFSRLGAVNDYSYGVYIYAFPIQQLLAMWGVNKWGYAAYTFLTLLAVIPLAVGSWWLVEKHALKLKKLKLPAEFRRTRTVPVRPSNQVQVETAPTADAKWEADVPPEKGRRRGGRGA